MESIRGRKEVAGSKYVVKLSAADQQIDYVIRSGKHRGAGRCRNGTAAGLTSRVASSRVMVRRGPERFGSIHQEGCHGTPCWNRRVAGVEQPVRAGRDREGHSAGEVASEPEALVAFLRGLGVTIARVGLEAGPLSQWL